MAVDIIGLPAFILTVFTMYWSLPLLWLFGYLKPFAFQGPRNAPWGWGEGLQRFFKVTVLKINPGKLVYDQDKVIFLCNHRSWADFFMDVYMTEGRGMMLSRLAVLYVFPMFMVAVRSIRGVILFKRGRIADKTAFNDWIDQELEESSQKGLIVYPEGHRSTRTESLPLKRGMLHYAHSRGLPVQVIITRNKEHIISEKHLTCQFGVTLAVAHSDPILAKDYAADFDAFMAQVQKTWDETWMLAHTADLNGLPVFQPNKVETFPTMGQRVLFAVNSVLVTICFIATLAGMAWASLAGLSMIPPMGQAGLVVGLLGWCLACYFHVQVKPGQMLKASSNGGGSSGSNGIAQMPAGAANGVGPAKKLS